MDASAGQGEKIKTVEEAVKGLKRATAETRDAAEREVREFFKGCKVEVIAYGDLSKRVNNPFYDYTNDCKTIFLSPEGGCYYVGSKNEVKRLAPETHSLLFIIEKDKVAFDTIMNVSTQTQIVEQIMQSLVQQQAKAVAADDDDLLSRPLPATAVAGSAPPAAAPAEATRAASPFSPPPLPGGNRQEQLARVQSRSSSSAAARAPAGSAAAAPVAASPVGAAAPKSAVGQAAAAVTGTPAAASATTKMATSSVPPEAAPDKSKDELSIVSSSLPPDNTLATPLLSAAQRPDAERFVVTVAKGDAPELTQQQDELLWRLFKDNMVKNKIYSWWNTITVNDNTITDVKHGVEATRTSTGGISLRTMGSDGDVNHIIALAKKAKEIGYGNVATIKGGSIPDVIKAYNELKKAGMDVLIDESVRAKLDAAKSDNAQAKVLLAALGPQQQSKDPAAVPVAATPKQPTTPVAAAPSPMASAGAAGTPPSAAASAMAAPQPPPVAVPASFVPAIGGGGKPSYVGGLSALDSVPPAAAADSGPVQQARLQIQGVIDHLNGLASTLLPDSEQAMKVDTCTESLTTFRNYIIDESRIPRDLGTILAPSLALNKGSTQEAIDNAKKLIPQPKQGSSPAPT